MIRYSAIDEEILSGLELRAAERGISLEATGTRPLSAAIGVEQFPKLPGPRRPTFRSYEGIPYALYMINFVAAASQDVG